MKYYQIFICLLIFIFNDAMSKVRELETTRLMSTSGAGVASILVNESAFLNPAPIVFYKNSSFYLQSTGAEMLDENDERDDDKRSFKEGEGKAIVIADTTSKFRGAFSYQNHEEFRSERTRYSLSLTGAYSADTAIGAIYRYTEDEFYKEDEEKYHQIVLGATHIQSEKLSFGLIVIDPNKTHEEDHRIIVGTQYSLFLNTQFMFDYGIDPRIDADEGNLWRAAIQLRFFERFHLRAGKFQDKTINLGGNSWGLSWVGPKLSIDFATKISKKIEENNTFLYTDEKIVDTSFALSLRI